MELALRSGGKPGTNLALARQGRDVPRLREELDGLDLHCEVDPFRLEQVFRNIFENALAACRGPVRDHGSLCADASSMAGPRCGSSIARQRPGIDAEQRQRIFEPFFTTKTKGTGLGMAIAQRIVEAHGGQIAVGTGVDRGAEILITLPRGEP